jgi:NADH dehydrogenase [ubiquinone] 1 alpha subcomplex assembly factor 1
MAASSLKQYMDRSMGILRKNTAKGGLQTLLHRQIEQELTRAVMRMDISSNPQALPILSFASSSGSSSSGGLSHPGSFALGSDADIGGLSTSGLTPISDPSSSTTSHAAFHGNLSLAVPPQYQGKIRTGYAAFRTKTRPTLFGEETWDMSLYTHLKVVVGYRGWEGWRDRWVVNLQTDGPVR